MDSGGLHLVERWIKDCISETSQHLDYIELIITFLTTLPDIAVAERNIGTIFFVQALLPLAKSLKKKDTKNLDVYKKLKNNFNIVHGKIEEKEKLEVVEHERELAEQEAKTAALRLLEHDKVAGANAKGEGTEVTATTKPTHLPPAVSHGRCGQDMTEGKCSEVDSFQKKCVEDCKGRNKRKNENEIIFLEHDDGMIVEDDEEAVGEEEQSTPPPSPNESAATLIPAPILSIITPDTIPSSSVAAPAPEPALSSWSAPPLKSSSPSSSSSISPRQSFPRMWPAPPPLPIPVPTPVIPKFRPANPASRIDEYKRGVLKSILKKNTEDALPTLSTSSRRISWSMRRQQVCNWFGGMNSYYKWATPPPHDPSKLISLSDIDSSEYRTQEQRVFRVKEWTPSSFSYSEEDTPDDPAMVELSFLPEESWTSTEPRVIFWNPQDMSVAAASTSASSDGNGSSISVLAPPAFLPITYDIEVSVPGVAAIVNKQSPNIFVAIWDFAHSLLISRVEHTIQLSQLGAQLSKEFGKKYLSKCPSRNLKKVLESHPEHKFKVYANNCNVRMNIVQSDIWTSSRNFVEQQLQHAPVVLLKDLRSYLENIFGKGYLKSCKTILNDVLKRHPSKLFEIYKVELVSFAVYMKQSVCCALRLQYD